jgi:hypothetical protein
MPNTELMFLCVLPVMQCRRRSVLLSASAGIET